MIILTFLSACKPGRTEVPDEVISPDQMIQLLSDLHVAESVAEHDARKNETAPNKKLMQYRQSVLAGHKVSAEKFERSMAFYRANPDYLGEIYLEVVTELSKREASVSSSP